MKKTLRLLVVTFLAIFLTACNIQTVEQFEKMEKQEQSVEHSPTDEKVEQLEREEPTTPDTEQEKDDTPQQQEKPKETTNEETKQPQATEAETKKPATEKQEQTVSQQATKQQTVNEQPKLQVTEQPKQPIEQPQKKRSVTIAIHVDTLLKNWDLLDPSLQSEKYVPKNGVILKATTYELLSEKDTVWDVLQRATKEHKIQIEYQGANENIYNSVYVEGINHLYEFSAGSLSGWMYKVNGVYPNYGCSQYTLKDGDVIEWHYTVDLGRDLGHEWMGE
ncbi:MAG: DUF4430 domain-containing protein [Lysinibacillus sp.]